MGLNVVAAALSSPVPGVAGRAAWYAAWVHLRGPVEADWESISEARAPEGANADTVFVFDLLGRSFGRPAGEIAEWGAAFRDAKHSLVDVMPPKSPWLGVMTETERQVVRLRREQLEPAARERG